MPDFFIVDFFIFRVVPHTVDPGSHAWKVHTRGQGRIQQFHGGGGGGRKRLCARTHFTSSEPNSLSAGVRGPLKGPRSSRVVLLLSRAIWVLFNKNG